MKVYQEITLLTSPEIPLHFLWEKVFQQIHLALVANKTQRMEMQENSEKLVEHSEYGLSFQDYDAQHNQLGSGLRIFAKSTSELEILNLGKSLDRLLDYCRLSPILNVPQAVTTFARFKRVQFDTNVERLARRRAKRKGESFEQAMKHFNGFKDQESKLPFINVISLSNGERFRLFIEKEMVEQPETGEFTCYGLSKTATVPWFD